MPGGFKESPLKLNHGLGQLEHWNEDAIKTRAGNLAAMALAVWNSPSLPADVLTAYKPEAAPTGYTIADHPYLLSGPLHEVFERFRRRCSLSTPASLRNILSCMSPIRRRPTLLM